MNRLVTGIVLAFALCATAGAASQWTLADAAREDPALTARAAAFMNGVAAGRIDRSHVSPDVNAALDDNTLRVLAKQLTAAGDPSWSFVSRVRTPAGERGFYRLAYGKVKLRLSFGTSDDGQVTAFRLVPELGS